MDKEKLIGTWKFKSMKVETEKGEVIYPYGENLFGMLIYTPSGHMSVLLMNPEREKFASDDPLGGTTDEIKSAYGGFDAYCGTYSVDEEKGTVTHHVEGSKFPNWIGTNQVRYFEFSDNKLLLYATLKIKGEQWKFEGILKHL
ncbi:MAG: lipocalin-like domain-containing protein [Candidatus Stahlbacteria bacterium]|nr:MAG: lipocalin-like domain-containing protein [Candidatus Stahlbacteria bacterium]